MKRARPSYLTFVVLPIVAHANPPPRLFRSIGQRSSRHARSCFYATSARGHVRSACRQAIGAWFCLAVLCGIASTAPALAYAQMPAVSQPHAIAIAAGAATGIGGSNAQALLAGGGYYGPLGHAFGVGLDVAGAAVFVDGSTEGGVEVHPKLFWRDPAIGFLGAFGSVAYVDSTTAWSATLGGARYLGDWDIGASAGAGGTDGTGAGLFDALLGWYATDQLRLGASGSVSTEDTYGGEASVYWQPGPATSRLSILGVAGGGTSFGLGFYTVGVNLVIHFAEPKSLKRQLREDRI